MIYSSRKLTLLSEDWIVRSKNGGRETGQETVAVVLMRNDGGLDWGYVV